MKTIIYTDGSCLKNPGPGGWGVVISNKEKLFSFGAGEQLTTNNIMELKAVIEAMNYILKNEIKEVEIYSDSAYVVNAIRNQWLRSWIKNGWKTSKGEDVKNKIWWEYLLKLMSELKKENVKWSINKVKGHAGNTLNEMVDKVARGYAQEVSILT